ncbi:MAG: HemK2/MTQ2 family protein methyltransferase [archaeon]
MKRKTFFQDFTLMIPENVYFPEEDSELLAENLKIEKNSIVLDLGCGSGIQSLQALKLGAGKVFCLDLNPLALKTTKENLELNGFKENQFTLIESNLFEKVPETLKFDLIIFNPPYVQTQNLGHSSSEQAVNGGHKGRQITDVFLKQFSSFLKPSGTLFLLQSNLNNVQKTKKILSSLNFQSEVIACKKLFFEELVVLKAKRKTLN